MIELSHLALAGEKADSTPALMGFPMCRITLSELFMNTQESVKRLFNFHPESGVLTWKIKPTGPVNIGDIAGTPRKKHHNNTPYVSVRHKGKDYMAHRIIWLYVYGYLPDTIDHINGDGTDNRLCNLREANHVLNGRNRAVGKNNKSGVMGVCFSKGRYRSTITVDYKRVELGFFDDFFDAVCARKSAERKYGFHLNHGRLTTPKEEE